MKNFPSERRCRDPAQVPGRLARLSSLLRTQVSRGDHGRHDTDHDQTVEVLAPHLDDEDAILDRLDSVLTPEEMTIGGIRSQHPRLRQLIDKLGPMVQLHVASLGLLHDLIMALRDPLEVADPELSQTAPPGRRDQRGP